MIRPWKLGQSVCRTARQGGRQPFFGARRGAAHGVKHHSALLASGPGLLTENSVRAWLKSRRAKLQSTCQSVSMEIPPYLRSVLRHCVDRPARSTESLLLRWPTLICQVCRMNTSLGGTREVKSATSSLSSSPTACRLNTRPFASRVSEGKALVARVRAHLRSIILNGLPSIRYFRLFPAKRFVLLL